MHNCVSVQATWHPTSCFWHKYDWKWIRALGSLTCTMLQENQEAWHTNQEAWHTQSNKQTKRPDIHNPTNKSRGLTHNPTNQEAWHTQSKKQTKRLDIHNPTNQPRGLTYTILQAIKEASHHVQPNQEDSHVQPTPNASYVHSCRHTKRLDMFNHTWYNPTNWSDIQSYNQTKKLDIRVIQLWDLTDTINIQRHLNSRSGFCAKL